MARFGSEERGLRSGTRPDRALLRQGRVEDQLVAVGVGEGASKFVAALLDVRDGGASTAEFGDGGGEIGVAAEADGGGGHRRFLAGLQRDGCAVEVEGGEGVAVAE